MGIYYNVYLGRVMLQVGALRLARLRWREREKEGKEEEDLLHGVVVVVAMNRIASSADKDQVFLFFSASVPLDPLASVCTYALDRRWRTM